MKHVSRDAQAFTTFTNIPAANSPARQTYVESYARAVIPETGPADYFQNVARQVLVGLINILIEKISDRTGPNRWTGLPESWKGKQPDLLMLSDWFTERRENQDQNWLLTVLKNYEKAVKPSNTPEWLKELKNISESEADKQRDAVLGTLIHYIRTSGSPETKNNIEKLKNRENISKSTSPIFFINGVYPTIEENILCEKDVVFYKNTSKIISIHGQTGCGKTAVCLENMVGTRKYNRYYITRMRNCFSSNSSLKWLFWKIEKNEAGGAKEQFENIDSNKLIEKIENLSKQDDSLWILDDMNLNNTMNADFRLRLTILLKSKNMVVVTDNLNEEEISKNKEEEIPTLFSSATHILIKKQGMLDMVVFNKSEKIDLIKKKTGNKPRGGFINQNGHTVPYLMSETDMTKEARNLETLLSSASWDVLTGQKLSDETEIQLHQKSEPNRTPASKTEASIEAKSILKDMKKEDETATLTSAYQKLAKKYGYKNWQTMRACLSDN